MLQPQINGKPLQGIKNVIFDLGGVIVNIDYQITIENFKALGIQSFDQIFSQYKQSDVFDLYDKGITSSEQFYQDLIRISNSNITRTEFDKAWNSMILDVPAKNIKLLGNLKNHFNTYLLSNTNEIHLEFFFNYLKNEHGVESFGALFHKPYYSCRVQLRKPDLEIFQFVIQDSGIKPEETLFIDDTSIHIESAKQLGIIAHHLKDGEKITDIFSSFID